MSDTTGSAPHMAGLNFQPFRVSRAALSMERSALPTSWILLTEPSANTVMETVVSPINRFSLADLDTLDLVFLRALRVSCLHTRGVQSLLSARPRVSGQASPSSDYPRERVKRQDHTANQ